MQLPSAEQITRAVQLYLDRAYLGQRPPGLEQRLPDGRCDVAAYLMGKQVERDPADCPIEQVRSFAMRLGNDQYPHMKLRLSRPPRSDTFVFSVDSHDAFLAAPKESPDYEPLEALKKNNATLADMIAAAWEAAGLPTERSYMRQKLQQARERKENAG